MSKSAEKQKGFSHQPLLTGEELKSKRAKMLKEGIIGFGGDLVGKQDAAIWGVTEEGLKLLQKSRQITSAIPVAENHGQREVSLEPRSVINPIGHGRPSSKSDKEMAK